MAAHALSTKQRTAHHRRQPQLAVAPVQQEPESTFDRDYWVGQCEGYRVDGHAGRIGVVDEVRVDPADPARKLLTVRAGMLGRRVVLVSSDEIEFIVPRAERIWIRSPLTILGTAAI